MESNSKVFISYSHDSDAHREEVLALSERLRADGIETFLDQYVNGSPEQGWPRWMLDQLDAATFVLVICTETYYRRFRGREEPGKGKGADWEGALITQEIYDSRSQTLKFVPVFLAAAVEKHIPEPLRPHPHYALTSEDGYRRLYDFLLRQAGVEPGPVGTLKTNPRRKGAPLTFDEPAKASRPLDISRIVKYAPAELIGREAETALLNDFWAKVRRAESADALHQAGRRAEAEARFREAEQMQAGSQPAYPLLYSARGFKYCDLLLTEAERAAWQMGNAERGTRNAELIAAPSPSARRRRSSGTKSGPRPHYSTSVSNA